MRPTHNLPPELTAFLLDAVGALQRATNVREKADGKAPAPAAAEWSPRVDIHRNSEAITILVELPGVDPKSVNIEVKNTTLTVKGDRPKEALPEDAVVSRSELPHGSFSRQFELPEDVDHESIAATTNHGVLRITLPKKAESAARRVEIR